MTTENVQAIATFAGGCFWCTEAIFERVKGVLSVVSGYAGGDVPSPSYEAVSSGVTHHAEAVQITYDPSIVSYDQLLEIFWATHDPTTLNKQGADVGTQYRSVIFYHTDEQKMAALASKEKLTREHMFTHPIVTEILPFTQFFPAEEYHQNFYDQHQNAAYCQIVIDPKLQKLLHSFPDRVKM